MLNVWNQRSGYEFLYTYVENSVVKTSTEFPERQIISVALPIDNSTNLTGITFSIISGKLPGGLRLTFDTVTAKWVIKGSALEVSRTTKSTFVIRATNGTEVSDRTFSMTVTGADSPTWITAGEDPTLVFLDFDNTKQYQIGDLIRYTTGPADNRVTTKYRVIADVLGITPPNNTYYQVFVEPSNQLAVGAVTVRTSNISQIQRVDNLVTITTERPHNFIWGNRVSIICSNSDFSASLVELLQPVIIEGESESNYFDRVSTTINYRLPGYDVLTPISATGTITLLNTPLTFVLDNSLVDFQLQAIDSDLSAGQTLEYFIASGDGELPPGLELDSNGRIYGIVDPILALDLTAREGFFDSNLFDAYAYDFGTRPNISDENFLAVITPRKLNRNYEFVVSVSDGETVTRRRFRIFVVGDDFLRADNTLTQIGAATFTADSTYLRAPIWLSAANLGLRRANNYVTIKLETFDPNPAVGPLKYEVASLNPDFTASALPDGLFIDPATGEIFGFAPYQPAVTRQYQFTINAVKYDKEDLTEVEVAIVVAESAAVGQNFLKINPLPLADQALLIGDVIRVGPSFYTITEYISETVIGGTKATLKLAENLVTDVLNGLIISKTYFTTVENLFSTQTSSKTFTLAILGEVDSVIAFTTNTNLGDIRPGYPSNFEVQAITSVPNAVLKYRLVSGNLPAGLTLSESGIILGKINQFRQNSVSGFTLFDGGDTTFDGNSSTLDRSYKFTINAQDQFRFSSVDKEFIITVGTEDLTLFSNIYTKPLPKKEKRDLFFSFINDTTIFTPDRVYRLGDPDYGLQSDLKMLVYAGIESKEMPNYMAAISKNIRRKRYRLGNVKKAIAKKQGSNDIEYEVLYIEVLDDYENSRGSAARNIKLANDINSPIKINQAERNASKGKLGTNSNGIVTYENTFVQEKLNAQAFDRFNPVSAPITINNTNVTISGDDTEQVYPSSIKNIRKNISEVGTTENAFLPLWMTTPQDNRTAATGFVKAIPICYCKPGEGQFILENVINSQFNFTQLDFEIDRFIIDSDVNEVQEKYLKFSNHRYNI